MNLAVSSKVAGLFFILSLSTGCALRSSANWAYVSEAWGGIGVGAPRLAKKSMVVPLQFQVHSPSRMDSAICINGVTAKTKQQTIYVSLMKGLCGSTSLQAPLQFSIRHPDPGVYAVVYDDEAAGFPIIGKLEVPAQTYRSSNKSLERTRER